MPELLVGKTSIPYKIRYSDRAIRKRIIVTPAMVEIIAPAGAKNDDVLSFINKKRRWIYDKREEMDERFARFEQSSYKHLQSGAKIPFRGRNMRLLIVRENCDTIKINYQNGFSVIVPSHIPQEQVESCVGLELTFWLKKQLKEDARQLAKYYCKVLNLKYKGVHIGNFPKLWGSCTAKGVINLNWHLIAAPKAVLEYVALHEVCHLKHRNHSKEFWAFLSAQMPDYETKKKWLEDRNPFYNL